MLSNMKQINWWSLLKEYKLSIMFIFIIASGVVNKWHLSLHDPNRITVPICQANLLGMRWETEERWNSSISESDSLTRPVEVLLSEVLAAEPGRLTGNETFPSQGHFPLLPQHLIFGKPAGCGIYYLFYSTRKHSLRLKISALVKSVLACQFAP